ncbi:MAG: hypothetical protein J7L32_00600 [Thermoplasmata archaeon]|nr:hypothetical protein [Thermoplasmata archaeon]
MGTLNSKYRIYDAIEIIDKLKKHNIKAGIVGSVLKHGVSDHDIDIVVECGKMPENLEEDELFDYISNGIDVCKSRIEKIFNTKLHGTGTQQGFPEYLFGYIKLDNKVVPVDFIPQFTEGDEALSWGHSMHPSKSSIIRESEIWG